MIWQEIEIIWEEDISELDYVREIWAPAAHRARAPRWVVGRRVGYAVLAPWAKPDSPGRFERRVFFLKSHDRSEDPEGVYKTEYPAEAVDPKILLPNVKGRIKEAWEV